MRICRVTLALLALAIPFMVAAPVAAQNRGWHGGRNQPQYDRGYRDGYRDGEQDARRGRTFDFDHDRRLSRSSYEFRNGYAEGYRAGFQRFRGVDGRRPGAGRPGVIGRRSGYQDPAFSRGFSDGYERGIDDGRDGDRYDPVRHRDYRDGDEGYFRQYGSRDAYENNYRAGFRQGYEQGYREGNRSGRRGGWWPF